MERVGRLMRRTMPSERVPGRELPPGFGHAVHDVAGHGQELFALAP